MLRQVIKLAPAGLGPSLLRKSSIYLEPPRKRERVRLSSRVNPARPAVCPAQSSAGYDTQTTGECSIQEEPGARVSPNGSLNHGSRVPGRGQAGAMGLRACMSSYKLQVNRLLYSLVNILFSAIAVFSASMYASSSYTWRWGIEARVLGSLLATLLVVGAEGYFFFRDWSAMAESGQGRRGRRRARGPRAKQD